MAKLSCNPILGADKIIADVEARVFGDRLYLYGTAGGSTVQKIFGDRLNVISTDDMVNYTDHGVAFSWEDLTWTSEQKGIWAPDCVEKDGKYYLYYCLAYSTCGVAVSDRPEGPFRDIGKIEHIDGIDPAVLIDGDDAYIYWGQGKGMKAAKLLPSMCEIDPSTICQPLTPAEHGYHEGVSVRKIGSRYYLTYTYDRRHWGIPTMQAYSVSDSPLDGFRFGGVLIDNFGCDPDTWNNHGSIECFRGQWYVFYHCSSAANKNRRNLWAEPISIADDGSIAEALISSSGPAVSIPAVERVLASSAYEIVGGGAAYPEDSVNQAMAIKHLADDAAVSFRYLEFAGETEVTVNLCAEQDGRVELWLDGRYYATVPFKATKEFTDFSYQVSPVSGLHTLTLRFFGTGTWFGGRVPLQEASLAYIEFK